MGKPNQPRDESCSLILSFITDHHGQYKFAPSFRQIADELGVVSTSTIAHHILHLKQDGFIWVHGSRGAIPITEGVGYDR